jgi:hypothetical protein
MRKNAERVAEGAFAKFVSDFAHAAAPLQL